MSDCNRVTLSGRLVADPELKYLPSGTAVTNLRLASNRTYMSNGERREEALFVDVEVYGKPAEARDPAQGEGRVPDRRRTPPPEHLGAGWPAPLAAPGRGRPGQLRPRGRDRCGRRRPAHGRGKGRPAVLTSTPVIGRPRTRRSGQEHPDPLDHGRRPDPPERHRRVSPDSPT